MDPVLTRFTVWIFRHRRVLLVAFALLTIVLAWSAARTRVDASFTKQLPLQHDYIRTFLRHQEQFGGANRIVIALMAKEGDIFTPEFFHVLRQVTDEVFYLTGVDRAQVQSLFTPNVRYVEVVEDGFSGGNVIPARFTPTQENFAQVRENIVKSGRLGQLVANDFSGAIVMAQLLEIDPATGVRLDYALVARQLEENIRRRYGDTVDVHIIGFAKAVGDIADGARNVLFFFALSFVITAILVWVYSHSLKLTALSIACSFVAVVWQLGMLRALGYGLDPLSILVPFLVFAIAVSHAVQMVRAFRTEIFAGTAAVAAAQAAFRQLLVPGAVALLTDTLGFLTIFIIEIRMLQELAMAASLGVATIIVTNLFLLPILLSYLRLPARYQQTVTERRIRTDRWWSKAAVVMRPGPSLLVIALWLGAGIYGFVRSGDVHIGDLQHGVPELRQDSPYNLDSRVITQKFSIGVDLLSVIVEGAPNACVDYDVVSLIDRFVGELRAVPGVQSVVSLTTVAKGVNAGYNEGSLKWRTLPRHPQALAQAVSPIETASGLLNSDGSVMPVMIFLTDHKAGTIDRVIDAVKTFREANPSPKAEFLLASGNVGVMAATNEVVAAAQRPIVYWVFGAVSLLCLLTFRSLRATLCIVLPLAIVSFLAYALMASLEIGLKPSTLPVVALGVGIGVDYGIYLFSKLETALRRGDYFEDAMYAAFTQTGSAIVFTGLTLAIGVSTWFFSALQFQADMGLLLGFMFLLNMLGAITLLPAMARWLYRHHTKSTP